ncbi:hypothetical protein EV363DRAFT_1409349 [Boletus edulis]|nr:hypothetical protein EV363DRAFT_1409349 [Boletus edulis]
MATAVSASQAVGEYLQSPDDLIKVIAFRKKLDRGRKGLHRCQTQKRRQGAVRRDGRRTQEAPQHAQPCPGAQGGDANYRQAVYRSAERHIRPDPVV